MRIIILFFISNTLLLLMFSLSKQNIDLASLEFEFYRLLCIQSKCRKIRTRKAPNTGQIRTLFTQWELVHHLKWWVHFFASLNIKTNIATDFTNNYGLMDAFAVNSQVA